ncbi:MAG: hypothetical protein ACXADB_11290, partial [Candidatus Hermodarchaeia archaeon]
MSTSIITTKLYIPPPPSNLISRPRLIEKLNQGLDRKLTLISAPAGFGKTTVLSECVAHCGLPVAWYSLDEGDDDSARFLAYLIAALQTIDQSIGIGVSNLLGPSQPLSIEPVLTELINQIARRSTRAVLVLDDYHVIESMEIDRVVSFFLSKLPPQIHLIIATRTDPTFPLSRLRSRGQLTEIRVTDLRFSHEEAALFLEKGMGLKISVDDIATLETRTEGWIAGLQLAAISMQRLKNQFEITRFVENFSSSNRYILDYLTDEVLQQRPVGTRDFLLQTSILNRLSAPLCQAVTEMENSQEILETLEGANLFLIPLDDERRWYRYHHLFGDLLRARLRLSTPDNIPVLHRRASAWFSSNDLISQAIPHSLAAEDFDQAALLTEIIFFDRMGHGEDFSIMLARLVALPEIIILARPFLGIMYAWMLSITLQLDKVEPRLVDIETRFSDQLPAELKRQIASIRGEVCRHQGNFQCSIKGCLQILECLPEEMTPTDHQTYTGIVTNLAWGYVLVGDMDQAQKWFIESLAIGQHSITLTLLGLFGLALVQELRGQLQEAVDTCQHGLQLIEDTPQKIDNEVPAAVYIHLRLGNLFRERGRLEEAEHHFIRGLELGHKWRTVGDTMRDGYIDLAKLKLSQSDFQGALDALMQTEKLLPHYRAVPGFGDTIAAQKARIMLTWAASCGDNARLKAVARWAEERDFSVDGTMRSIHEEFEYLVWVRLLLSQN